MHSGMRRVLGARAVAGVIVVGAVVSACGGPVQAGSAAIVGDTVLPLSKVQAEVAAGLATVPADQHTPDGDVKYARQVVSGDVTQGLLDRLAAAEGITVDDRAIDAFISDQGGLAAIEQRTQLTEAEIRSQSHNLVTAIEVGRRAAPGLAVTADLVEADSRAAAETMAHTLAAGGPAAAALLARTKTAQRNKPFTVFAYPPDPTTASAGVNTVIFGTSVGETVAFQPDPQGSWSVFRVTQRRTDAAPADPAAVSKLSQEQLLLIGQRMMQPLADSLGVRVNPRYGVWDPIALSVVAEGETAGIVLPAATG